MSSPASVALSLPDIIAAILPVLMIGLIIMQILDRRDRKNIDITKPIDDLKDFLKGELHKGDIEMMRLRSDINTTAADVRRVADEQKQARKDSGKILDGLAAALKSKTRRNRRSDESDDES